MFCQDRFRAAKLAFPLVGAANLSNPLEYALLSLSPVNEENVTELGLRDDLVLMQGVIAADEVDTPLIENRERRAAR